MSGGVSTELGPPRWWHKIENGVVVAILAAMVLIPVYTVVVRWTSGVALAGANLWVQALNLWVTLLGGAIAVRTNRHLSLSTGQLFNLTSRGKDLVQGFTSAVATMVTAALAYGSMGLVISEQQSHQTLSGGVPMWAVQTVMPLGFGVMAFRFAWLGNRTWQGKLVSILSVVLAAMLAYVPSGDRNTVLWAGGITLLVAVALGAPLFTAMGGMAMLLFYSAEVPISITAVPAETFRIVADPTLVSLPLFTLAGYLLAEGGASKRLIVVFQAWFGWLPGGVAAASVMVCAFFTTFTGASGVTILALGGLLLPALRTAGYSEKFAVGLLTASGSIGLLFPPSLPVILYGVASHVPIPDLFIGGIVPGIFLVSLLVGMSIIVGIKDHGWKHWLPKPEGPPFGEVLVERIKLMLTTGWVAKWELALPVVVLVGIFGGFMTIFEAAAITAAYAFFLEVIVHRDLHIIRDVPGVFLETASLMGGVLVILGVALGFTSYLVDAEVPLAVRDWVQNHVESRYVFLAALNLLLLAVGCLMDIYSAIVVVVPLIIPVAEVFGIHPIHLGILFLANLELGYLTPPVGLNLFLASFRFNIPLTKVYGYAMPFLGVMIFGVLVITYVPSVTMWAFDEAAVEPTPNFFEDELLDDAPAPAVPQLTPEQLDALLNGDPDAELPELGAPGGTPQLDMNAIFDELEEDEPEPSTPGDLDMDAIFDELEEE